MAIPNLALDQKSDFSMQKYFEICESTSKISKFLRCSKMKIKIQIVSIWTNFDIIYQNLPKFAREFENKAFLRRLIHWFEYISYISAQRCWILNPRPDLKWSLNSPIMIKANQHMFPNKILVKIANLSENLDYKSLKIVL